MSCIEDKINKLNLSNNIIDKLISKQIIFIKDIWNMKRKDLKELNFNDNDINAIIIALQLEGLDLNKKIYDK